MDTLFWVAGDVAGPALLLLAMGLGLGLAARVRGQRVTPAGWAMGPALALTWGMWWLGTVPVHEKLCFYWVGMPVLAAETGVVACVGMVALAMGACWTQAKETAWLAVAWGLAAIGLLLPLWLVAYPAASARSGMFVVAPWFGAAALGAVWAVRSSERRLPYLLLGLVLGPVWGWCLACGASTWLREAAAHGW